MKKFRGGSVVTQLGAAVRVNMATKAGVADGFGPRDQQEFVTITTALSIRVYLELWVDSSRTEYMIVTYLSTTKFPIQRTSIVSGH